MKCSREIKELLFLMFSYVINTYLIKISRRAHYFILFTRDIMSYVFFYFDYLFINEIKKKTNSIFNISKYSNNESEISET